MFARVKHMWVLMLCVCSIQISFAQPNSGNLPSLINDASTNKKQGDNEAREALLKQKMFVKVFTSGNKIFVGEPLMATYKFYVASNINDRPTVTKQPEFTGCSVKELSFDQGPEYENINNEVYAVYTIRRVQLTPLQEGSLSLGKAYVNNAVEVYNPDDVMVTRKFDINVGNDDVSVTVNSLPGKNKPADFYGITGTFNISAAVAKNKIPVGENGHLLVTIKGAGNIDAIVQPGIRWPHNIEHFDGKDSQHVNQDNFPVSGDRIFDIPFIGKDEGSVAIPPIKFSYFNTALKKYETVTTDSIPLTFTKALLRNDKLNEVVNYDITNRKYLWIVAGIAFIVAFVGFISYKRNKKHKLGTQPVVTKTEPPAFTPPTPAYTIKYKTDFSRYLSELKSTTDNKVFFTTAKSLLIKAVAEKLDSTQYSEQVLMQELIQKNCDAPVCHKAAALYEAINLNLYAPFETTADLGFYFEEIKQVVEALQHEG